jgi:acetyl esterase/lipase
MSEETRRHDIATRRVVYELPGADAVGVRRDVPYRETGAGVLTMDVYAPPDARPGARLPAVVFVLGYSDAGARAMLGCSFKEMGSFVSWARLVAASGLAAITYATGADPAEDMRAVLEHLRRDAASLGVDENRIGVWACSGHVPNALAVLMTEPREQLKCAALCYGFMLDVDGSTAVADAAEAFRFVNPCAGKSVDDLPSDTPLFVVRAGRDEVPRLNETLDRFVAEALRRNLPLTLTNHPTAPHAFDLMDDGETSREIIRRTLDFLRFHLLA